ncbi:hypothetical protein, partial [Geodermatophilus maliterrae]
MLDAGSTRVQPRITDLRQCTTGGAAAASHAQQAAESSEADVAPEDKESPAAATFEETVYRAEECHVEVTLIDLDPEVQQLFDGFLEPQDKGGLAATGDAEPSAKFCVRLAYRLTYDSAADALEHFVYYPVKSSPASGQFARVPADVRRALPVVILQPGQPLQLRAEGGLRRILSDRDPTEALAAFERLADAVAAATSALGTEATVTKAVDAVLNAAALGGRLGDFETTSEHVSFAAEDGSLSALLRAVQPALRLDGAGTLPLSSHGSSVAAVFSAAEAILQAQVPGGVVLSDDFGDQLDVPTAEHLAGIIRSKAGQAWLSTRRPDVVRAF